MRCKQALFTTVVLLLFVGTGHPQEASSLKRPAEILMPRMVDSRESYIAAIMLPFRANAQDRKTLTQDDINRKAGRDRALRKSMLMGVFFNTDVNGDNVLDANELAHMQINSELRNRSWTTADMDGDGKVTVAEALAFTAQAAEKSTNVPDRGQLERLLALDPNHDGKLTADELEAIATAAFAYYDKDGDGILSPDEKDALNRDSAVIQKTEILRQQVGRCAFPKADPRQKVYVIASYEGGTLSNTTVSGQDKETETSTIDIADGSDPLYLAVSSYTPMIWRITGHVERVASFFGSARGGVGVLGLPREKVVLTGDQECINRLEKNSVSSQAYLGTLASVLGHPIDGVLFRYTAFDISLPSDAKRIDEDWQAGKKTNVDFTLNGLPSQERTPAFPQTLSSLRRFSPGGIANIDPKQVVASEAAERYQILPQEAGLLQLLQDGSLEETGKGYLARKPFARYPAGLAGAHSVAFVFPEGMQLPAGSRGHSRVQVLLGDNGPKP
ncbi:hypothetical protein [Rhizobium sp. ICMP 5592]|uniref:EF-hand domain-containing protein n=1 Tax=Rhizobium sp. ICMP 5592 TaxID=2292445 RepID=UPI00188651A3|nr:hypothetical protein [Rhizobium sp. ICMP 5592]